MDRFTRHTGVVMPLDRVDVDTDQIIPKQFLKSISRTGFDKGLFYDWRFLPDGSPNQDFVLNDPRYSEATVLVSGRNFGSGSSREHAPWALTAWGIRSVISTSFADIFRSNCLKNSLLPIVVDRDMHEHLFSLVGGQPDVELTVDLESQLVHLPGDEDLPFDVDPFARLMLLAGTDELGYLLSHESDISRWEFEHRPRVDTLAGS
jgi:3-isopropylmalate/(R)-2-methylmalate dehydratase small subunit